MYNLIGRQLNIADYALGSLSRNLWKNAGVVLVFGLVVFLVASFSLVTTGLKSSAEALLKSVPDITVQQMSAGRQAGLNSDAVEALGQIYGIREIRTRIWGYYFDPDNGANYTVIGDDRIIEKEGIPGIPITYLPDPESPLPADRAVLGQAVTGALDLGERRSFSLFRPDLSVKSFIRVGQFDRETAMVSDDLIVMGESAARDLFALDPGEVSDIIVSVANPLEVDTIAAKISSLLPGVRVVTKARIAKTYRAVFGWRSGFGLACLFGAAAAFFILAWDKASGLTPDQRRETAILKVLGWHTEDVITLRFWESIIICLAAFMIGYSAAWIHVLFFDAMLFRPVMLGWSVLKPTVSILPSFAAGDLLIVASLSILPYLAATVIPAWRSATIRPESVI